MNRKVRETIERFGMLGQGDTVVAAVSGGADSVALLDFLCAQTDMGLNVRACHVNHCLRGAESERDEQLVRTMCGQYGVPLDVLRVDIGAAAKRARESVELTARRERYRFFGELALRYHAKVATAHTMSDAAETVFLNMARGTGLEGICGIPAVRGEYIRPLRACTRQEIEAYCVRHDLAFVHDSSNDSDEFTRNYIRHKVVPPFLGISEGAGRSLERMTLLLRDDADYLRAQAADAAEDCTAGDGFSAEKLRLLHPALRSRVLLSLLEREGLERSAERVAQMALLLDPAGPARLCLARDTYAVLQGGVLLIERRQPPPVLDGVRELPKDGLDGVRVRLGQGKMLEFFVCGRPDYEIFKNNPHIDLKGALDYDKMDSMVVVRSRKGGDRIRLAGRGCSKSLKKLYNELKILNRDFLYVLADNKGVLYAEGAGTDERARITPDTKTVVAVEITEDKRG